MSDSTEAKQKTAHTPGPVAWSLIWSETYGVNTHTTFKTEALASDYANRCGEPTPRIVPLFAAAPDTAAERDRLREINAELVKALRSAHHALTVSHNLRATDLTHEVFDAHLSNGVECAKLEWHTDNSVELGLIDSAITKAEGK